MQHTLSTRGRTYSTGVLLTDPRVQDRFPVLRLNEFRSPMRRGDDEWCFAP